MSEDKYIILYSDEFKIDIWCNYMNILGLPHNTCVVKISIKNIIIKYLLSIYQINIFLKIRAKEYFDIIMKFNIYTLRICKFLHLNLGKK